MITTARAIIGKATVLTKMNLYDSRCVSLQIASSEITAPLCGRVSMQPEAMAATWRAAITFAVFLTVVLWNRYLVWPMNMKPPASVCVIVPDGDGGGGGGGHAHGKHGKGKHGARKNTRSLV